MDKNLSAPDLVAFQVERLGSDTLGNAVSILQNAEIHHLESLFLYWRKNPPDLEGLVKACCDDVGFSEQKQRMINVSAVMAAEDNGNDYHNNHHFREVFALMYMMAFDGYRKGRITKEHFARRLSAALLHDYKHDGLTNNSHGEHQQFRLEQQAFDEAHLRLVFEGGATQKDLRIIEAMILSTDVSAPNKPDAVSPADSLKNYVEHGGRDVLLLHPKLRVLHDENLVDTALLLHDADIAVSAAISPYMNVVQGKALQKEWNFPKLPDQGFFLSVLCRSQLYSRSARELLQPAMNDVLAHYGLDCVA
ncbi:MAG: hypothetical protein AB8B83_02070 [Bdellovibrionales bacterium]